MIIAVKDVNEFRYILKSGGNFILDFTTEDSDDCKALFVVLESLNTINRYSDSITILKLDWDAVRPIFDEYNVSVLPTLVFISADRTRIDQKHEGFMTIDTLKALADKYFFS